MKLACSLAMLAAATLGVLAQHEDCGEAVLATISKYEGCSDMNLTLSSNDSSALTAELLEQVCTSDCMALATEIEAMGTQECEIAGMHLLMDIVEPIEALCGANAASIGGSGAGSITDGSVEMEMEDSDDDTNDSAEATAASSATSAATAGSSATSSNSAAPTPTPSATTSGSPTTTLAASALLLTGAAAFAL